MSAPDPEGMGLLATLALAATGILAPIGAVFLWIDGKFARKHSVANALQPIVNEQAIQRKAMEDHARRDEDLFRDLFKTIADNHADLLRAIGEKADRP